MDNRVFRHLNIFSVYSQKSAAFLQVSMGKNGQERFFLSVAPKAQDGNPHGRSYTWDRKKSFKLERHELFVMKEAIKRCLDGGSSAARAFCESVLGKSHDSPYFLHKNPASGKRAMGGIVFKDSDHFAQNPDPKFSAYAPFVFQVSYMGGDAVNGNGINDTLSCPVQKAHAWQIACDLEVYLDESVRLKAQYVHSLQCADADDTAAAMAGACNGDDHDEEDLAL